MPAAPPPSSPSPSFSDPLSSTAPHSLFDSSTPLSASVDLPACDSLSSSLDEADRIRAAMMTVIRRAGHPVIHQRLERTAGIRLDKVSEVLMSCLASGSDCDLRLSDVAARLGVELSSVSRKVQKLEDSGYVARSADPTDARASRLQLTKSGKVVLDALDRARRDLYAEVLASWSIEDRSQLAELVSRFSDDLTTHLGDNL